MTEIEQLRAQLAEANARADQAQLDAEDWARLGACADDKVEELSAALKASREVHCEIYEALARADGARDKALVEAAERFPDGRQPWPPSVIRKAILALRDKPAPAVTVQRKSMSIGFDVSSGGDETVVVIRNPTAGVLADLRAIAGGGDE